LADHRVKPGFGPMASGPVARRGADRGVSHRLHLFSGYARLFYYSNCLVKG